MSSTFNHLCKLYFFSDVKSTTHVPTFAEIQEYLLNAYVIRAMHWHAIRDLVKVTFYSCLMGFIGCRGMYKPCMLACYIVLLWVLFQLYHGCSVCSFKTVLSFAVKYCASTFVFFQSWYYEYLSMVLHDFRYG